MALAIAGPRRLQAASTTRAGTSLATWSCARPRRRWPPTLRRSDRVFRVGGDEFALILPDTDVDGAQVLVRRLLAACLDGRGRPGRGEHRLVLGRDQRRPDARHSTASRSTARRTRAVLEQAPRPDLRDDLRPEPTTATSTERPVAELSAAVAQVAAIGAIRAVFQPIFDLSHRRAARLRGPRPAAPGQRLRRPRRALRGRRGRRAHGRARHRVPQHGHGDRGPACACPESLTLNLSPRTLESDDFSVHALLRMIVRHGLDPRNGSSSS